MNYPFFRFLRSLVGVQHKLRESVAIDPVGIPDFLRRGVGTDDLREVCESFNDFKPKAGNAPAYTVNHPSPNTICYKLTDGSTIFGYIGYSERVRMRPLAGRSGIDNSKKKFLGVLGRSSTMRGGFCPPPGVGSGCHVSALFVPEPN